MSLLTPLRKRPIALLWLGQVLSNVGDEIYGIAVIWLAAGLIGVQAGYLSALQSAAVFACGVFGGRFADRLDQRRTMVTVDLLRGLAVLTIPMMALHSPPSLYVLIPVAVVVSGLSAFFLPALKASLPRLAADETLLQQTNALMESTLRLARVLGPGAVGLLNAFVPLIHFFTVDAISFFCSALSIGALHADLPPTPREERATFSLRESLAALHRFPRLEFATYSSAVVASLWWLCLSLGMALLLHQRRPTDVGALGWLVAAYGVGNLISNVVLGSVRIRRPASLLSLGRLLAGLGFILMAGAGQFWLMVVASAIAALGGPMTDLATLSLLAESGHIARFYRLGMALDYGCMVATFLVSPTVFERFGVAPTMVACGSFMTLIGLWGLSAFRSEHDEQRGGAQ